MSRPTGDCNFVLELIGQWVDDDLAAETRRRVESHLMTCQTCAWEAQTQRIARERLREHAGGEVLASDAFRARALARLRADNPHITTHAEENASDPTQYRLPIGL